MRQDSLQLSADAAYGKAMWLAWTGYNRPYRSFDRGGWDFVVLDSGLRDEHVGYAAKLSNSQAKWLEKDLAETSEHTPVCIVSHVPILSAGAMFFEQCERSGHWHVPRSLVHIDARWIKDLLVKHPNVK